MTDKEKIAATLGRMANIANGLSKSAHIVGYDRDAFVSTLRAAERVIKEQQAVTLPFQSDCPECGKKITVAYVNGMRRVKWGA